jgi:HSP20 family protein
MALHELLPRRRSGLARREWESPIETLHEEMEDLFNRFFWGTEIEPRIETEIGRRFVPSVNVSEDDKEILVTADVPGLEEKDLDVTITRDSLTIKGEKKEENEEKGKNFYRMERNYGSFTRVIPLTSEVDEGKAKAKFKNGVLKITLPKSPKAQTAAKKIEVAGE